MGRKESNQTNKQTNVRQNVVDSKIDENRRKQKYELNSVQKLCGTGFSQFLFLYVI